MRFALVEGEPREATPDGSGTCRVCGDPTIAKCGRQRIWHWAHKQARTCDTWWEPETLWHREWKDHFPKDWQECIHLAPDGEKHIADVRTGHGVTLEFQHSFLPEAELLSREQFYPKLIWVIDGKRRTRDRAQFFASLGNILLQKPLIIAARTYASALLRDWKASRAPVYLDFGDSAPTDPLRFDAPTLWRLNPSDGSSNTAYLSPVAKSYLIGVAQQGVSFEEPFTKELHAFVERLRKQEALRHRAAPGFNRYMAPTRGRRRL